MTDSGGANHGNTFDRDWGEQLFQAGLEFAENPEPRCPCILLLDTSRSMENKPIAALNEGLQAFRIELLKDPLAKQRVEIAIITFGGTVRVIQNFITVDTFTPPLLTASGQTPMGTAILTALDLLDARKAQYLANGIAYYRPWIFLITDGAPKGEDLEITRQAVQRLRADETAKKVALFAVGVEGANMKLLAKVSVRPPLKLKGLRFVDMFVWLSKSAERVAHSQEGEQVALPPVDWGTV
ncbi:MAG: VWA domain-containing protein [Gemmataceae bacterium]|nr:VWA domain-containing protein [Gemmataceae bacterium]